MQPVPYRGDAPLNTALIAGEIQVAVVPMATVLPHLESGLLKALAIGGAKRSPALPNVATIGETVPGFESTSWQGYFVPAGTPRDIVQLLARETAKALKSPDVMERLILSKIRWEAKFERPLRQVGSTFLLRLIGGRRPMTLSVR